MEEEVNIVMANSPTHTVGYEVNSKLEKVKHSHPMLSIDKTKSVDELKSLLVITIVSLCVKWTD